MFTENGDIRLRDGPNEYEGRVEIFWRHQWGTICDDSWSIEDANVVCEQLGYGAAVVAREGAYYGPGVGNITLDEVSFLYHVFQKSWLWRDVYNPSAFEVVL